MHGLPLDPELQHFSEIRHSKLSSKKIVEESLNIAAEIDIYTNHTIQVEELACEI